MSNINLLYLVFKLKSPVATGLIQNIDYHKLYLNARVDKTKVKPSFVKQSSVFLIIFL
jgi:hypothetical protein